MIVRRLALACVSSLAIAGAMLACGARTGLGVGAESDAALDHPIDHVNDAIVFDTFDVVDVLDASDAPDVFDAPLALCDGCSLDLNANQTPVQNNFQGAQWLAYELPMACDQFAAWIAIHDNTSAIRVYVEDGTGAPGAEVLPPTATTPMNDAGWYVAPAGIVLKGGRSYYVATAYDSYTGTGATLTAWSVGGTFTRYYGSFWPEGGSW